MDLEMSTGKLRQTIARTLALLAIAAAAVALVVVISGSLSDSDGDRDGDRAERHQRQRTQTQDPEEATYVVQPNDTLAGIAQQTGVSLERLQQFNCTIDPQALPAGATLQLREPAPDCGGGSSG